MISKDVIKQLFVEAVYFTKASVIMTIISYSWMILIFDVWHLKAWYMGIVSTPIFFVIRFFVYKYFAEATFGKMNKNVECVRK